MPDGYGDSKGEGATMVEFFCESCYRINKFRSPTPEELMCAYCGASLQESGMTIREKSVVVIGQDLGCKLAPILGIPKNTVRFSLHCAFNEIVTVECVYHPEIEVGKLTSAIAEYELVERTHSEDSGIGGFDAWMESRKQAAHEAMCLAHFKLSRMDERLFCNG